MSARLCPFWRLYWETGFCQSQLLETVCLLWLCTSPQPPSLERVGWVLLTWHRSDFLCCLHLPPLRTVGITLDNPVCCFSEFPLPLWSFWHCFWHSMCGIFSSTNQFSSLQKQHQISGSLTHLNVLRLTSILIDPSFKGSVPQTDLSSDANHVYCVSPWPTLCPAAADLQVFEVPNYDFGSVCFSFSHVSVCFMYFESLLFDVHICRVVMSSSWTDLFIIL